VASNQTHDAFDSAVKCVEHCGDWARRDSYGRRTYPHWTFGADYQSAIMEFHTLRRLVTPAIRAEARVVYPPANPAMTLFRFVPVRSILEAVEGPLFEAFQSAITDYRMRANGPDAPDVMFGIDFHELETLLREEWNRLGRRPLTLLERHEERRQVRNARLGLTPFVGTTRPQRASAAIDVTPVAIHFVDANDVAALAIPETERESASPALTGNQLSVLRTMAGFDGAQLLSTRMIMEAMDSDSQLSEETVRKCLSKMIASKWAERPEGDRSGVRLTIAGRRLVGKIAD